MGRKGRKLRADLRKNRQVRTREKDLTRKLDRQALEDSDTPRGERISFGEARSDAIYRALTESVAANETREQFLKRVLAGLKEAGIDPNAPHRNLPASP